MPMRAATGRGKRLESRFKREGFTLAFSRRLQNALAAERLGRALLSAASMAHVARHLTAGFLAGVVEIMALGL